MIHCFFSILSKPVCHFTILSSPGRDDFFFLIITAVWKRDLHSLDIAQSRIIQRKGEPITESVHSCIHMLKVFSNFLHLSLCII